MNAIRGTVRLWVVVALIGWTIAIAIPIIFQGGSVRGILNCVGDPCQVRGGWPWEWILVVGCLVILAIGFLTRKRT